MLDRGGKMKIKYFPLMIFLIIYLFLFAVTPHNYRLLTIYILAFILYTMFISKSMLNYVKKKRGQDLETSNETVSGMSYFDRKKTEEPKIQISFDDVAGLEEIKEDLTDIIDFLNNEEKYRSMDAKVPRGILLYGPPGTGKTLIAKAIAGEAKATFIYSSGSEFVEKYVGVGAKRVRTMFDKARKEAPSIIFIDEIDALGAKRNTESNNEKDQTLNQLLIELDGFNNSSNVIVVAATNRIDLLDEALLRPGRFDRKIYVGNPNYHSRLKILEVHTKNKPLDKKVQLEDIAIKTHGFSGAQLANIANEAALKAIKDRAKKINSDNFEFAIEKIAAGLEIKNSTVSEKEKRIVAYHEAGHAAAAKILDIDKVQKISIIPRDKSLGYVLKFPTEDKYLYTKNELCDKVVVLLAGRAAEEVFIGEISTGAANDIKESTNIIHEIICSYGMGKNTKNTSIDEKFIKYYLDTIKEEAAQMAKEAYDRALSIIRDNEEIVEKIAQYLLNNETMNAEQLDKIMDEKRALI
ncbi:MAG: ATP-dependent zinc metalloprotease FtsH [Tissierellia bacterium]|nr:ATP-dependent zinc metalloprotease FtsH [Tissierellia bacterium]